MSWTASDFERLDPRLFRSFLAVVKTQSFSAAADEASLTQGAVSQQIAKLEDRLSTQLFVRVAGKVLLTVSGQLLAEYARAYMEHATHFLDRLNKESRHLGGEVSYAMPESCIHAPHFGWLLESRRVHPDIVLRIELLPSVDVMRELLKGKIDFGFINQHIDQPGIQRYPFCFEEYVLVQSAKEAPRPFPRSLDELVQLPMVLYPGMIDCLNQWIGAQFGETDRILAVGLRMQGEFNDMRGALAMVEGALGVTVMPMHVVQASVERGSTRIIQAQTGEAQRISALQQISIIRLRERLMPARVKCVIRWFLDMHTELQPVPEEFQS